MLLNLQKWKLSVFHSDQRWRLHFGVGLAAAVKVSSANTGWPSCPPAVPFAQGTAGDRWWLPQVGHSPSTGSAGLRASAKKEQGLSGVRGYRAGLGKYCNLHTMCLYLFALSGINYALQMVMKSFVARLHEGRISPTARDAKCCPGWAEPWCWWGWGEAAATPTLGAWGALGGARAELALEKPLHDTKL